MNQEKVRELFNYCDGKLFWAVSRPNAAIGSEVGTIWRGKRCQIRTGGRFYLRSRLVWVLHFGDVPNGAQVDHINNDSLDDRIENLRLATSTQNHWNTRGRRNTASGAKGVSFDASRKKPWMARIKIDGKTIYLGRFVNISEAANAYALAAAAFHGEFMNLEVCK